MEEAEKNDQDPETDPDLETESAAQRARMYKVIADSVESQGRILLQLEQDLKARPTKTEGLAWIMAGFAIVLLVVGAMFTVVLNVSQDNQTNNRIIRAATGCGNVSSVRDCERVIATRSQAQYAPFLQQQDCLFRRALAHLPPPERYDLPCELPR